MILSADEERIRGGEWGEAPRRSIEEQIAVGEFFGAERFVPVSNVHMMGDYEVMGEAGTAYLSSIVDLGGRVCVPSTRNAACIEYEFAERLHQSPELVVREGAVRALLGKLGVATVDTCINYQSVYTPRLNEHVAWGDTGTVAYANSVLGARTNYESGPAAIAAALTGRTPEYGFHLPANRRANVRCIVEARLSDVADYGALGAIAGERARGYWNVPAFELRSAHPGPDDLKHLGASIASFGSLAMFHVVGATPEAPDWVSANGGRETIDEFTVTDADIEAVYARGTPPDPRVDLVVFTAPQLSLFELQRLAQLFGERRVHDGSTVLITTNGMMRDAAHLSGVLEPLTATGALILQGVCWYIMDPALMRKEFGWTRVCTNSAKLFNIIKAHGYEPVLRRTADCVETAIAGRLP